MRTTLVFLLLCGIAHAEERLLTKAFRHGSQLTELSLNSNSAEPVHGGFFRCRDLKNEGECCKAHSEGTAQCQYLVKTSRNTVDGVTTTKTKGACTGGKAIGYLGNTRKDYSELVKCVSKVGVEVDETGAVHTSEEKKKKCRAIKNCDQCVEQECAYLTVPGSTGGGVQGVATVMSGWCTGEKFAMNLNIGDHTGQSIRTESCPAQE